MTTVEAPGVERANLVTGAATPSAEHARGPSWASVTATLAVVAVVGAVQLAWVAAIAYLAFLLLGD